jgi:hypothetical protein
MRLRCLQVAIARWARMTVGGCDAVLQDLAASKRINAFVHAAKPELDRFRTTIVSELFWPPFQGEPVELPPQVHCPLLPVSGKYT